MFPIYMRIKAHKRPEDFEIIFDNNYEITFENGRLTINKKETENNIKNFYSINETIVNIDSVNLLIGKNGSGKTTILRLLTSIPETYDGTFFSYEEIDLSKSCCVDSSKLDYFIIYKDFENEKGEKFIIEKRSNEYNDNKDSDKIYNMGMARFYLFDDGDEDFPYFVENKYGRLNSSIKYQSKEKVYTYLNNQNKLNKKNFENARMIMSIKKDGYIRYQYDSEIIYDKIIEELKKNDNKSFPISYSNIILHKINQEDSIESIILKNYCNILFFIEIYYNRDEKLTKDYIKRKKEHIINNYSLKEYMDYWIENSNFKNMRKKFYKKIIEISEKISSLIKNKNLIKITNNEDDELLQFYINDKYDENVKKFLELYDNFIILEYGVYKRLKEISGENITEVISINEEGLSDGEKIKLQYFSSIYGILKGTFKHKKYVTFLFDEVETYLHPEWCRRFLYELIEELGRYKDKKFKLIFATHSPFLIADVLAKDCIYLSKDGNSKIQAEIKENVKTFGANIIDLFKNTMFLESTFGKFATEKIKEVIDKIEKVEKYSDIKHEVDFIINEIGEKLISNKLKSMIESKFENKDEEKDEEYYRKKIEEYQAKLGELEKKENNRNSKK